MMKRVVLGLVVAVMVVVAGTALFGQNAADFTYEVNNGAVTITEYTGSAKNVTIPGRINGLPVTAIGKMAFYQKRLTSVTIPHSVVFIGEQAFAANKLTSVTIPNSVTAIGNAAFAVNQLTSVTIPGSVTAIGNTAFYNNRLTSVTIPGSIASIGWAAFRENQLANVTIPADVNVTAGSFPGDTVDVYIREGKRAGTYISDDGGRTWRRQ
jgi:hypothetical protein